jgi:hypothetical protein
LRRRSAPAAARAAAAALLAVAAGAAGCAAPEELKRNLDVGQATVSRGLADVVDGMDRAFGEPRVEDRERIARLKLGVQTALRENQSPAYSVPVSLRVPLPALERRANIYLQLDSVADTSSGINEAASSLDRNKTLSATLLTRVRERVENGVRLDLTWHDGPQTGFRPFLRWEWRPGRLRLAVEQQVYYLTDKGFGAKTQLELDRLLGTASFVRWRSIVEGNEETPGTDFQHVLIFRRPYLPWDVALSAEVGVSSNSFNGDPQTRAPGAENDPDQGFAQLRVIGTVFRPWIEYEITPALFRPWRHRDDFEYGVTFTLRIVAEHALRGPQEP